MKPSSKYLFFCGLVISSWSLAKPTTPTYPGGHGEYSQCEELRAADAELNATYQQIQKDYARNDGFLKKLKEAQKAWLKFRDAHLESIFPAADKKNEYGSDFIMCDCVYRARLTKERVAHLKAWIEGVEEGEVCSGTYKVKRQAK